MKLKLLNGNEIKILACIFMFIDHLGMFFYPNIIALRIIGRLAMPLFAFFIAEGAHYTKNKTAYLSGILMLGLIIASTVYAFTKEINLNILISFSFSLILIYIFDKFREKIYLHKKSAILLFILFIIYLTGLLIFLRYYYIEYQLFAILIPFGLSLTNSKFKKNCDNIIKFIVFILFYTICMFISSFIYQINTPLHIQAYGYFASIFILLYNNKRGRLNLKYLFYIFYPLHIGIMYLIK